MINPATILSNQKSTARVNLLSTYCNCLISTWLHSNYLIWFVMSLSLNLNIHSCNTCGKSKKNTSCKSLNTYVSRYLYGVMLGFMFSFYTNSISFVFNQLSIYAFVGLHGLNIYLYSFIIFMILPWIPLTQSHEVLVINRTICWFSISWANPGS